MIRIVLRSRTMKICDEKYNSRNHILALHCTSTFFLLKVIVNYHILIQNLNLLNTRKEIEREKILTVKIRRHLWLLYQLWHLNEFDFHFDILRIMVLILPIFIFFSIYLMYIYIFLIFSLIHNKNELTMVVNINSFANKML